jgi:hypothetical protein
MVEEDKQQLSRKEIESVRRSFLVVPFFGLRLHAG